MNTKRMISAVAAALVVGVVAGNVVSGFAAAPAASASGTSTATSTRSGLGLRLGAAMQAGGARLSDVVAKLTGLPVADVTEKRAEGTSYASIASSKGVTSASVIAESLKVRKTLLDAKVKAGTMTQAQEDAALANMQTRLTERVSATDQSCTGTGGGMGGGQGRGMGRGAGGAGCGMGGAGCVNTASATQ